jgi:predicted transcriptional regulator
MTARKEQKVGRAELEILHYVQDHHPVTVRDVMERLRKKGFLSRRKVEGVFHYQPRVGKADLLQSLVRDFVEKTLGGSLSPFVAYLSRDAKLSDEELKELKEVVAELKGKERR